MRALARSPRWCVMVCIFQSRFVFARRTIPPHSPPHPIPVPEGGYIVCRRSQRTRAGARSAEVHLLSLTLSLLLAPPHIPPSPSHIRPVKGVRLLIQSASPPLSSSAAAAARHVFLPTHPLGDASPRFYRIHAYLKADTYGPTARKGTPTNHPYVHITSPTTRSSR